MTTDTQNKSIVNDSRVPPVRSGSLLVVTRSDSLIRSGSLLVVTDSDSSIHVTFNKTVRQKCLRRKSHRDSLWYTPKELKQFRKDYEAYRDEQAAQQRVVVRSDSIVVLTDSDPSIHVTFNKTVKQRLIRRKTNIDSLWYTPKEMGQFRQDYISYQAAQERLIWQENLRNRFEIVRKLSRLGSKFRKRTGCDTTVTN